MSFTGRLLAINIAPALGAPVVTYERVEAVPGQRLGGDRPGFATKPSEEVTLVEAEACEAVTAETGRELLPVATRRNLVTRGVPLNHLVGRRFRVGEVVLEGIELCEPCGYLEELTGRRLITQLRHRGGLGARVVQGGVVAVDDVITPEEAVA